MNKSIYTLIILLCVSINTFSQRKENNRIVKEFVNYIHFDRFVENEFTDTKIESVNFIKKETADKDPKTIFLEVFEIKIEGKKAKLVLRNYSKERSTMYINVILERKKGKWKVKSLDLTLV